MVTLNECIGMSGLDEDVIAVIARHQRIPEIAAVELGAILLKSRDGRRAIRTMIAERADHAMRSGKQQCAASLRRTLSAFDATRRVD
jgi:hypothetical protein